MAKAYWISSYRAINDADKMAAYAALARPAIEGAGGTFIARGMPAATYELGMNERVAMYGGHLEAGPRAAASFAVHAQIPLEAPP